MKLDDGPTIIDAFSLKQYAYNTMIEHGLIYIRSLVGDIKSQKAHINDITSILEDGYYLVVSKNNTNATVYHRVTQDGWINNEIIIKPILYYYIRECTVRQETPIMNQTEINVTPKRVPTSCNKQYRHILDELRERLAQIRKQVALT